MQRPLNAFGLGQRNGIRLYSHLLKNLLLYNNAKVWKLPRRCLTIHFYNSISGTSTSCTNIFVNKLCPFNQYKQVRRMAHQNDDGSKKEVLKQEYIEVEEFEVRSEKPKPTETPKSTNISNSLSQFIDVMEQQYQPVIEQDLPRQIKSEKVPPIDLTRSTDGVYAAEEMVTLLKSEGMFNICVIKVPEHFNYVDYMIIASGKSGKQVKATAEYAAVLYKKKRRKGDPASLKLEASKDNSWVAFDTGNLAVHLFLEKVRRQYDIEMLWSVGDQYDSATIAASVERDFRKYLPDDVLAEAVPAMVRGPNITKPSSILDYYVRTSGENRLV